MQTVFPLSLKLSAREQIHLSCSASLQGKQFHNMFQLQNKINSIQDRDLMKQKAV